MMDLDHIDKQILNILMQDANTTSVDVAKQIHVSPGTVHVRIKNLKRAGVIQGAALKVDYAMLGFQMQAFVGVYLERSSLYTEVVLKLQKIPEVVRVHYTSGPYNIFVEIVCKDSQDLHSILHHQIQEIKGVQRTESLIVLDTSLDRSVDLFGNDNLL